MNSQYIQHLRYKLQKRVRRLNSVEWRVFHASLKQFWVFLKDCPLFVGVLDDLKARSPSSKEDAEKIMKDKARLQGETELELAALSYYVIESCVASDDERIECKVAFSYAMEKNNDESTDRFRSIFLEPFYEYLDEQLDDQRAILALLRRYKHKCEWFNRKAIFDLWDSNTSNGEKLLAFHLYEYLYDQGLDFVIEPLSASGEADLIASQQTDDPLIADVKIFNPEKSKGTNYIAKGFNQIYLYTLDYNEPFGYLIIFNTSGQDLRFVLSTQEQSTPLLVHNNKTIFLITIDIFPHKASASKRGKLKTIDISEDYLIQILNQPDDKSD